MIKNERQYRITKAQADRLARALNDMERTPLPDESVHPLLVKAEEEALQSQLADLQAELAEYEALRSGDHPIPALESFVELPKALIQGRIASGLSQKQLAERLGIKEQQIQRYEATEYASASLSRVRQVVEALGMKLKEGALPSQGIPLVALFQRLRGIGIDREFALRRLIPRSLAAQIETDSTTDSENLGYRLAAHVGQVFGWTPSELLGSSPLKLKPILAETARFKTPIRTDERRLSAYTVYAHYLALIVGRTAEHRERRRIPIDPYEMRRAILSTYGTLTLDHVLRYVWSLGIPVIPMNDPGAFHGACFREGGRNVIVAKQKTPSQSRWMFDVFHEVWHASQEPEQADRTVIEDDDMSSERRSSKEERTASQFAGAVLLGKSPQKLAELCLNEANRDLRFLKSAVERVAASEDVPIDSLANYVAFRLSLEGENWWGTASNLQERGQNPWLIARDVLLEHVDLSRLADPDLRLLQQALLE
ncbi:MAG: helix-turn-helix transcriptional regulator [Bacillota bacterium]|nr:helix-turn-helix transcriptional regulator [Bacillota bacterium]